MKYAPPIGQEAQGEAAHYIDGNPELGILGSPVPAAALEPVQRELVHVIREAGLEPSAEDLTQLFQAICKLIGIKVPLASPETPGLMRVGAGLTVTEEGLVSVDQTSRAVPVGFVGAFSGSFGGEGNRFPLPPGSGEPDLGWCLCDGIATNGFPVPDLRGRMILGASDDRPAGSAGGAETHTHSVSGTVGPTTLSVAQLASHTHTATGYSPTSDALDLRPGSILAFWDKSQTKRTVTTSANGSSSSHTHGLTASSGAASSLPPYYTLAFIMRCA